MPTYQVPFRVCCTLIAPDSLAAANAIFFNHGQCCCAGSRLFVEQSAYDEVVDGLKKAANNIKLGRGLDLTTQMGPLYALDCRASDDTRVSKEQHQKVLGLVESGKKQGTIGFNLSLIDRCED